MTENTLLGELICKHLKENGQSITWLAKQLHCDRKKLYLFFKTSYSDTEFLFDICRILKCDFFPYFSKQLSEIGITHKAL
ncbi:MAG: XRE family transcriptional regulator [Prevotellaceae bacterium]|nr:XRE family transcriptional regulator [Prevotellaceae bacterium]